jgi:hypothetical protein
LISTFDPFFHSFLGIPWFDIAFVYFKSIRFNTYACSFVNCGMIASGTPPCCPVCPGGQRRCKFDAQQQRWVCPGPFHEATKTTGFCAFSCKRGRKWKWSEKDGDEEEEDDSTAE